MQLSFARETKSEMNQLRDPLRYIETEVAMSQSLVPYNLLAQPSSTVTLVLPTVDESGVVQRNPMQTNDFTPSLVASQEREGLGLCRTWHDRCTNDLRRSQAASHDSVKRSGHAHVPSGKSTLRHHIPI